MQARSVRELPQPHCGKTGWPWNEESPQPSPAIPGDRSWPLISIVTPSFNQGRFLEETIRSVLLQGYPNLEYIIVDGGSTDNSIEIIKQYEPWLTFWTSEKDRGQSHAINKGLKKSRGDIFAYLNSDDIYLPGTVQKIARYFHRNPSVDIVYGDCRIIDEKSNEISQWCSRPFDLFSELCINFIYQPTSFIRHRVMTTIGDFDENLHYTMDIDYWYRAACYFNFEYFSELLACFRLSSESKTGKSHVPFVKERKRVLERFLNHCEDLHIRRHYNRILSWHHYHAGEQLFLKNERRPAIREFLAGIRFDPVSLKTLHSIAALIDCHMNTNIFPTIRRYISPRIRRK